MALRYHRGQQQDQEDQGHEQPQQEEGPFERHQGEPDNLSVFMSSGTTSDPKLMQLTEEELRWAHEIKAAINASPDLKNLSDYECAQWAIVTLARQDLDEVWDRVYKLQCFVEEHRLHQNPDKSYAEEGLEIIQDFCNLMPGYLLSIEYMPRHGHYLLVSDKSAFCPERVVSSQDWTSLLGSNYFMLQLMNSHLAAVRHGFATIMECKEMGFHNFSASVEERLMTNVVAYMPLNLKESIWLNSPTAANVFKVFMKPFMREEIFKPVRVDVHLMTMMEA